MFKRRLGNGLPEAPSRELGAGIYYLEAQMHEPRARASDIAWPKPLEMPSRPKAKAGAISAPEGRLSAGNCSARASATL